MGILIKPIKVTKTYYAHFITTKYSNCWVRILGEHNYPNNALISRIVKSYSLKKSHFKRNILNTLHSLKSVFLFLTMKLEEFVIFLYFKLKITSPKMEI